MAGTVTAPCALPPYRARRRVRNPVRQSLNTAPGGPRARQVQAKAADGRIGATRRVHVRAPMPTAISAAPRASVDPRGMSRTLDGSPADAAYREITARRQPFARRRRIYRATSRKRSAHVPTHVPTVHCAGPSRGPACKTSTTLTFGTFNLSIYEITPITSTN